MKKYKAEILISTPVIIHTGETFDFLQLLPYKNDSVCIVDPQKFFLSLSDTEREEFDRILDNFSSNAANKEAHAKIREYVRQKIVSQKAGTIGIYPASKQFVLELEKNPASTVYRICTEALSGKAIIPGSSIKGNLRTGILEALRKKSPTLSPYFRRGDGRKILKNAQDFEMEVMTDKKENKFKVDKDPFKYLKVSDFTVAGDRKVFGTVRVIGRDQNAKGIPIYTEMTDSVLNSGEKVKAEGTISIDREGFERYIRRNGCEDFLKIDNIIQTVDGFYVDVFHNKKHPPKQEIAEIINKDYTEGDAMMRIGRFCQIESKTFKIEREGERYPNINIEGGISRSYINGTDPAGWCILRIKE